MIQTKDSIRAFNKEWAVNLTPEAPKSSCQNPDKPRLLALQLMGIVIGTNPSLQWTSSWSLKNLWSHHNSISMRWLWEINRMGNLKFNWLILYHLKSLAWGLRFLNRMGFIDQLSHHHLQKGGILSIFRNSWVKTPNLVKFLLTLQET